MDDDQLWRSLLALFLLTSATLFTLLLVIVVFSLPSSYTNIEPRSIKETAFSETDRRPENAVKSGWKYFTNQKAADEHELRCETSVQILVLGDIGRSPRMQYHALSIARRGGLVDIVGYTGAEILPDLLAHRFVTVVPVAAFPAKLQFNHRLLFLLVTAPCKIIWQSWALFRALGGYTRGGRPASKYCLLQNPPSIPTLAVAQLVCYLRKTKLVVDWHNFGHTILAMRLGVAHPLVRIARWYEGVFSRGANAHFAVTHAMTKVLRRDWGIEAVTLHDRPADLFRPFEADERHAFLARLAETKASAAEIKAGRTRLIVSSTSWTADEDFGILLAALQTYAAQRQAHIRMGIAPALPALLAIITGRGPQRAEYLARIDALTATDLLPGVTVLSAWLTPQDYAALLASADLGISLHTSSSGVDLPMKVVDMFGAGLPVAGWSDFEAWPELVQEGVNGRGFSSSEDLRNILVDLCGQGNDESLARLRQGARREASRRWEENWGPIAGKLLGLREKIEG